MSFNFNWPTFSDEFRAMATQQLEIALNKGEHRPSHICDDIRVKELFMGTTVGLALQIIMRDNRVVL